MVDQVCIADGGMPHDLLAAIVPLGEDELLAAARGAVSRRLLVATADGYAFPHDLVRQVFYGQLLPGERRRLHRRVAEALAARPEPDPAVLALHWQLADAPDLAAPAALLAARRAVSARAYPEADHFYAMAADGAGWLPEPAPDLLEEAARAASWAGRPERAAGYTAGRAAEALGVARHGRQAARSLGAPPALTSVLDNNTAAVLTATGRWAEAGQLLAELIGESRANVTRYLQLLQLELAVGRGEREHAREVATSLAGAPEDPRLLGPLHACLAEQALNTGDLVTAADQVLAGLAGLAGLKGAALAGEEIRLLAAGARVSADLASLPGAARPAGIAASWEPAAASLAVDFTGPADPGVVVLNGAALSFAVLCPATPGS